MHRRGFGVLMLGITVSLAACGSDGHAPRAAHASARVYTPRFATVACPTGVSLGAGVRCGRLTVPERRASASRRDVRLFVTRYASRTQPVREPVLVLQGGPGETPDLAAFVDSPLRDGHELIILDQRGTGRSVPSLACPEVSNDSYVQLDEDPRAPASRAAQVAAASACHDRLAAASVDLAAYNTAENARDVADLRVALRIREWDLAGNSYGSRLALTVLRDHPQGVRSLALSGVDPPDQNNYTAVAGATADALDQLFAPYPGLRAQFVALVRRLERAPVRVIATRPDGRPLPLLIDGDNLMVFVREALYQTALLPTVPLLIRELVQGKGFDAVGQLVAQQAPALTDASAFAFGMHYAVQCQEDIPRIDLAAVRRAAARYPSLDALTALVRPNREICARWHVGRQPEATRAAVRSAVPVVMFTGALDPATPPAWLRTAATTLAHGYGYVLPGYGHDATTQPCPRAVRNAFFVDPVARPADACLPRRGAAA